MGLATGGGWGVLGASVVLLVGWLWLRRQAAGSVGTRGPARAIRLSSEHAVHVVEVEGRTLLVGTGPGGPPTLLLELATGRHHGA